MRELTLKDKEYITGLETKVVCLESDLRNSDIRFANLLSRVDQLELNVPIERATRNNLPKDAVGINVAGKMLGSSGTTLAAELRKIGAFVKYNNTNEARPKYTEAGLFCKQTSQTFITAAGMSWIRKLIARHGIRL